MFGPLKLVESDVWICHSPFLYKKSGLSCSGGFASQTKETGYCELHFLPCLFCWRSDVVAVVVIVVNCLGVSTGGFKCLAAVHRMSLNPSSS